MESIFDEVPAFINSAVGAAIKGLGYLHTTHGPNDFRFKLKISSGEWFRAQVITSPESSVIRLFVYVTDVEYPETRSRFVSELAQLATDTLVFGAFVQGPNGSIAFRDGEQVSQATADIQIANLLNRCAFPIRLWNVAFGCWKFPKSTANSALKMALLIEDLDIEALSIPSTGHLLAVEKGNGTTAFTSSAPNLSLI